MQLGVPETTDLQGESEATRRLYGLDQKETEPLGRQCLARRMLERGVPFRSGVSRRIPPNGMSRQSNRKSHGSEEGIRQ